MSSLSVSSAEFVPGQHWEPTNASNAPVRPKQKSGLVEFVPGKPWGGGDGSYASSQPQQWSNGEEQSWYDPSISQESNNIFMVKDALYNLGMSPGLFEGYMASLVETLNATIKTEDELDAIADIVFEQSVGEPNFRYTGARACDYLTLNLKLQRSINNFRSLINQRVKNAVMRREEMANDPNQMTRLHGATMFLAELFLNTNLKVQGNPPQRIKVYRLALEELMNTLVKNASSDNLKCLGKLLKLSGKEIEDYDKETSQSTVSKQLNEVFKKARLHVVNEAIDKNVRELWLQLIELRATHWGQQADTSSHGGSSAMPAKPTTGSEVFMAARGDAASAAPEFSSEPVFYNQQGQVITAAEAGFEDVYDGDYGDYADNQPCDEQQAVDPYAEYDLDPSHYHQEGAQDPDYADDLDDLDAEIQAAFSDFLVETGQGEHS